MRGFIKTKVLLAAGSLERGRLGSASSGRDGGFGGRGTTRSCAWEGVHLSSLKSASCRVAGSSDASLRNGFNVTINKTLLLRKDAEGTKTWPVGIWFCN